MITIENALNILKNDHNFREIIDKGQYFYHYRGLVFEKISYDSREVDASALSLSKVTILKKNFWKKLLNQAYSSMSVRRILK